MIREKNKNKLLYAINEIKFMWEYKNEYIVNLIGISSKIG